MPAYFEIATVGGNEVKNINITVYDSQGGAHVLSGALVRTDTDNTWDMVLTSITAISANCQSMIAESVISLSMRLTVRI